MAVHSSAVAFQPPGAPGILTKNSKFLWYWYSLAELQLNGSNKSILRPLLGAKLDRLQLLRSKGWRCRVQRLRGRRKRCAWRQKRGKRAGMLAKARLANMRRVAFHSIFLANISALDEMKLDLLRLRLSTYNLAEVSPAGQSGNSGK